MAEGKKEIILNMGKMAINNEWKYLSKKINCFYKKKK